MECWPHRYQGGDAAVRFAEEKQKASRGGADGPYLGKDVQAGDEAFCTTGSKTHRDPPMTTPVGGGGTATSDRSGGADV